MKFLYLALAVLALAAIPVGVAAAPSQSLRESGSGSSGKPEIRDDKSSPSNQFLTAYNSMSLADWLSEKGMQAEAADLYTEARDLFGKLATDNPQWQPALVSFRINYCLEALKRLQGQVSEGGKQSATDDSLKKTPDVRRQTPDNGIAKTGNQAMATSNAATLSPLNFKLQQAALRERDRDYGGALAMYSALLEEFPREPWALKGACRCCLRLGQMDKARALIHQALTLPAPDADINLLAALIECKAGHYQEAINLLRQSLKQNGARPEAHVALGVALASVGQMEEAQKETKRALLFNSKLGDAYYNLARLSLQHQPADHDTARVHYQNALQHGAVADPELDALLAE